jgi:hypothetical protein
MKFIPELSVSVDKPVFEQATKTYEIYLCYFGRRMQVIHELNATTIEIARTKKITELQILCSDVAGDLDLSVLTLMPELKAVYLHLEKPVDLAPLQHLTNLQKLTLIACRHKPQPLDFTKFPHLHTLRLTWHEEWRSVVSCNGLRGLTIENSKKVEEFDLRGIANLKELCLTKCLGLRTIRCEPSQSLDSLGIAACPSFESVQPFEVLKTLKYVLFDGKCRFDIQRLGECRQLKRLSMWGVGRIRSIQFLANCPDLERFAMHFSTQVEDGDLTALINAPKLRQISFRAFKNYTHTLDEVKRHHGIS